MAVLKYALLEKACCNPSGSSWRLRKLTLKVQPTVLQLQTLIFIAAKCNNQDGIINLLFAAYSYLSVSDQKDIIVSHNGNESGDTLLHLLCREYGWNISVLTFFEFDIFLRTIIGMNGSGLFTINSDNETPVQLACENGSSPSDVMSSILELSKRPNIFAALSTSLDKEFHKSLLSRIFSNDQRILHFIQLIAQFNDNDPHEIDFLMRTVIDSNHKILSTMYHNDIDGTGCIGCLPIHIACFYQNAALIEYCLLNSALKEGLLNILSIQNDDNSPSHTPLDYLVKNLGSNDDQYTWQCLDACVNAIPSLSILNLIIENVQGEIIRNVLIQKGVLNQIIARYNLILTPSMNTDVVKHGTILLSAIKETHKWKLNKHNTNENPFYIFCNFLAQQKSHDDSHSNVLEQLSKFKSMCNTKEHQRLPLHSAVDSNIHWNDGLELLLHANFNAVEEIDPHSNLPTFLLAASCSGRADEPDLNAIYNILRLQPDILFKKNKVI